MEKLKLKCQELDTFPIRGQQRNDLMDGLRVYPLGKRAVAAFLVNKTFKRNFGENAQNSA